MSLSRPFVVRISLALATGAGVAMFLGLGGVFSCSTYPTHKNLPIDCSVQQGYEFSDPIDDFTQERWYSSPDYTPPTPVNDAGMDKYLASMPKPVLGPIPDGPVCGVSTAGLFQASHNNDWGGVFGMWGFANGGTVDGSSWQGISFWARAPGNTTKVVTLLLDDINTMSPEVQSTDKDEKTKSCRKYQLPDGGTDPTKPNSGSPSGQDPVTGTPISGSSNTRAAYPDECGNSFYVLLELTSDWQLYTFPWSKFQQSYTPNRVPNKALPVDPKGLAAGTTVSISQLRQISIRPPKEAELKLWMANLAFYRKKGQSDAGAGDRVFDSAARDSGNDSPQSDLGRDTPAGDLSYDSEEERQ